MNLRDKLRKGVVTIGSWITIPDTIITEIMAKEGFDWLTIDMEHSAITIHEAQQLIQLIEALNVIPLVRVGENNHNLIKRVMDSGAHGVIVPMVNSAYDAKRAVEAVKYPTSGNRGVGLGRAQGYGLEFKRYKNWVNKNSIVVAQIEHIEAINNLEEILRVEGIDATLIGPYDLSSSLGCTGEFEKKAVKDAISAYLKICRKMNKPSGFHIISPHIQEVNVKIKEGFRFLGFSLDTLFLGTKIRVELAGLKRRK